MLREIPSLYIPLQTFFTNRANATIVDCRFHKLGSFDKTAFATMRNEECLPQSAL